VNAASGAPALRGVAAGRHVDADIASPMDAPNRPAPRGRWRANTYKRPDSICKPSASSKPMLAATTHLGICPERLKRNTATTCAAEMRKVEAPAGMCATSAASLPERANPARSACASSAIACAATPNRKNGRKAHDGLEYRSWSSISFRSLSETKGAGPYFVASIFHI